MRVISGIGARKTPREVLKNITRLGELCRELGIWVRSGHASGADYAWERGAREKTIVYLPKINFNMGAPLLTPHIACVCQPTQGERPYRDVHSQAVTRAWQSIRDHHPTKGMRGPAGLKDTHKPFLIRNYFQVFGCSGIEVPVDAVVFWAPEDNAGNVKGGTGQAVRIARAHGIPTWNLAKIEAAEMAGWLKKRDATTADILPS